MRELKQKRITAGIPGRVLCPRARISPARLSEIERGYIQPSPEELLRIQNALDQLITAREKVQDRVRLLDLGADDFLPKPLREDELRGEIGVNLEKGYRELGRTLDALPPFDAVIADLRQRLPRRQVITVNSDGAAADFSRGINFIVGGNILGRGLTIENLLVTYYLRSAKISQMDTMLQHARMFGYRFAGLFAIARYNWQAAFVITGGIGLLWVLAWWKFYHPKASHPALSPEEVVELASKLEALVAGGYAYEIWRIRPDDGSRHVFARSGDAAGQAAIKRLQEGTIDIVTLSTTQTSLFQNLDLVAQTRTARFQSLVSLYQALGGGWTDVKRELARISEAAAFSDPKGFIP